MFKVIKYFTDLQDREYPYNVGDTFPREGFGVAEERLKELAGNDNKQGEPLIEYAEETKDDDHEETVVEEEAELSDKQLQEDAPEVKKKPAANKRTAKKE